ncbi:DUF862-domain-containing protein [Sporormia fimetaria CBS 119925]|uniref:DUF862-domain-containing protein n=1 Tax=Sporormia fimetaria CBS 119925 TaxID=1340428 RepID=A0A6A6VBF4_9PLEO|nr:DUF862-domain-containing protein [Sporormia fimetaria CBS 119925]
MSSSRPTPTRKSSSQHRSTLSLLRTEIKIHVYDLLPPGKIATVLWTLGTSLLHSGVIINDKEYAFGGHDRPGLSGVYYTRPGEEPPGGTFRQEIVHGFTFRTDEELKEILQEAMERFQGTSYNLLTMNCNHFTSYLCERLTGRAAPSWLNRAAGIGVALPCVVPREWIDPPDYDTADGELLDDEFADERSSMLRSDPGRQHRLLAGEAQRGQGQVEGIHPSGAGSGGRSAAGHPRYSSRNHAPRLVAVTDTDSSGRPLPVAERAPLPKRMT